MAACEDLVILRESTTLSLSQDFSSDVLQYLYVTPLQDDNDDNLDMIIFD